MTHEMFCPAESTLCTQNGFYLSSKGLFADFNSPWADRCVSKRDLQVTACITVLLSDI